MTSSVDFLTIQRKWLRIVNRRSPFGSFDKWLSATAELLKQQHHHDALTSDVHLLSDQFGLPDWYIRAALFTNGKLLTTTNNYTFPKDVRYPKTALVISGPITESLIKLGSILYERDINLEWETAPGCFTGMNKPVVVSVELPMEIPSSDAVSIVRRSRRHAIDSLKLARIPITESTDEGVSISAVCYSNMPNSTDLVSQASNLAGLPVEFEPYLYANDQPNQLNPNPLSYLRMKIRFSPIVSAKDLVAKTRETNQSARVIIRALGVNIGQRLRPSPLTKLASRLKVDGNKLPQRGLGDLILDDIQGFPNESCRPTEQAQVLSSKAKSRRNQVLQRFREKGMR